MSVVIPERDSDGNPISRGKASKTGWTYHLNGVEFVTSKIGSIVNKDVNGDDLGFTTYKIYDDTDTEITLEANQGNAVKTVIDWEPTFDYEIVGGHLKTTNTITDDVYIYVLGVPDLTPAQGGSKEFISCINMKFIKAHDSIDADGRATKFLPYDATYHTNKMRITLNHPVGLQCEFLMIFEIFKA